MSSPQKAFLHGTPLFITTRTKFGLPFVASKYMEAILWSVLARAQHKFPVSICHFTFMANHLHMVIVVTDPELIPNFICSLKTEISHAVSSLLGRKNIGLWESGYDSPTLATPADVVDKIIYTYTNPQKANLVDTMDEYPGVSTWKMWRESKHKKTIPWVQRNNVPQIPKNRSLSVKNKNIVAENMLKNIKKKHEFQLEPDKWMECFSDTELDSETMNADLLESIRSVEQGLLRERRSEGKHVMGKRGLETENIRMNYIPESEGRRSVCICSDPEIKKMFLTWYYDLIDRAKAVYRKWKAGNFSAPYPAGLFPPSMPIRAHIYPPGTGLI